MFSEFLHPHEIVHPRTVDEKETSPFLVDAHIGPLALVREVRIVLMDKYLKLFLAFGLDDGAHFDRMIDDEERAFSSFLLLELDIISAAEPVTVQIYPAVDINPGVLEVKRRFRDEPLDVPDRSPLPSCKDRRSRLWGARSGPVGFPYRFHDDGKFVVIPRLGDQRLERML